MKEIVNNPEELERWIKMANSNVRLLNAALKKCELSLGTKTHVESSIARMKGYGAVMKTRLQEGAGRNTFRQRRKERLRWEELNRAFQGRIRTGVIINLKHTDPLTFLEDAFPMFKIRIQNILKNFPQIKVNTVFCEYVQDDLIVQLEDFQEEESGWTLKSVVNLAININRYEPIRGSSYMPLPPEIVKKQAVINVKNNDDACFAWAVVSALHRAAKNSDRVSSYPHYSAVLNLDNITFPMTINQLQKFVKQNQLSINVFMLEETNKGFKVVSARITKQKLDRHINLLIIQNTYDNDGEEIKYHWCWIKNLSRLIPKQVSAKKYKVWTCERCLHYFYSEEKLKNHEIDCSEINECRVQIPYKEEDKSVKFKNYNNFLRVPFIRYADFESLLKPTKKRKGKNSELYQEHEAFSVGYYFHCSYDDSLSFYKSHRGSDCRKWFARELKQIAED
ncbi:hypothetical protein ILUMI_20282, partial [Ignelater luminosus]